MGWITPLRPLPRVELEPPVDIRNRGVAPLRGRKPRPDRPFNMKDDAFIIWAADQKMSFTDVAGYLGRTRCSIGGRARRLGVRFHGREGAAAPAYDRGPPPSEPHSRDWRKPGAKQIAWYRNKSYKRRVDPQAKPE